MIRFTAVTKHFGGQTPALADISFDVEKGEFVFLTGQSGSGKSTLLKLITKEYSPTEGEVEFEQVPLSQVRGSQLHNHRRRIGVVFQDYRLLPELNVWENIALPLEIMGKPQAEIEERVTDLLELVQLIDKPYAFPTQLSGGESQRVGIARALATAPSVLLADEPTGNLDPETTLMIARLFHKIHELGTTILFATHDPSILATFPNRRLHLEKGRLIDDTAAKGGPKKTHHKEPAVKNPPAEQVTVETTVKVETLEPAPSEKPAKKSGSGFKLGWPFGKKKTSPQAEAAEEKKESVEKTSSTEIEEKPSDEKVAHPKKGKKTGKADSEKSYSDKELTDVLVQVEDLN